MAAEKGQYGYSNDGFSDYIECIYNSWTWARLSEEEKSHIIKILGLSKPDQNPLPSLGDYEADWTKCSDIYTSCLALLKYDPINWREPDNKNCIPKVTIEKIQKLLNETLDDFKKKASY